jgi:hypothetical protein
VLASWIGTFGEPREDKKGQNMIELVVGCDGRFVQGRKGEKRDDQQGGDKTGAIQ